MYDLEKKAELEGFRACGILTQLLGVKQYSAGIWF